MQLSLLLLSLLLSAFQIQLPVADGQSFDFPSGKLDSSSLLLHDGEVDSTGTLTLNSSTETAYAFYSKPIALSGTISQAVLSFTSFFTFSSTATSGNGTIAFVLVPDVKTATTDWVTTARQTFSVEFNTSCSTGPGFSPNGTFYGEHGVFGGGWGGGYGRGGGWRGTGPFGGIGGFQVVEYANNTAVVPQSVSGYGPNYDAPLQGGPYFCSQEPPQTTSLPTFQYEVVVEYNASTKTLWVGSPSCGVAIARTTQFASLDLSSVITTPVYPGFLVYGGAAFNITQWNFTNNVNTSSVTSLVLSSVASVTPSSSDDGSPDSDVSGGGGGRRGGGSGLKKGYVIAFSVLGAAIGVAAVLLVCCLCARRRRAAGAAATGGKYVGKRGYAGAIPESAVVFDAHKPNAPPAKVVLVERDTMPLNSHPSSASTGGAASWLKPVQPR